MTTEWQQYLEQFGELQEGRLQDIAHKPSASASGWLAELSPMVPVAVTGADAEAFLHGQLSADLSRLGPDQCLLTAWHDARGRIQSLMHLFRQEQRLVLILPEELLDAILKRLRMYVLRQDVHFERLDGDLVLTGMLGADPASAPTRGAHLAGIQGLSLHLGTVTESIALWDELVAAGWQVLTWEAWRAREIALGIPRILAPTQGTFLPQFVDLERFEGLHYDKGCYIGQEVIARTHHLGTVKRGLYQAHARTAVPTGEEVRDGDGASAGQVLDCAPEEGGFRVQMVLRHSNTDGDLKLADGTPLEALVRGSGAAA